MRIGEIFCIKNESKCSKTLGITGVGSQSVQFSQTNKLETLNGKNNIESKGEKNVGSNRSFFKCCAKHKSIVKANCRFCKY
jgi:hypothetical protein